MNLRIGLVSLQFPAVFLAGAAWGSSLSGDGLIAALILIGVGGLMWTHFRWAQTLVELGYAAGRLDAVAEFSLSEFDDG